MVPAGGLEQLWRGLVAPGGPEMGAWSRYEADWRTLDDPKRSGRRGPEGGRKGTGGGPEGTGGVPEGAEGGPEGDGRGPVAPQGVPEGGLEQLWMGLVAPGGP